MLKVKTYKNWKELCNAMDWSNVRGDTKKKYLKQLESICKYHKDGNKIVIDEIYEIPKPIEDNRGGKSIFKDDIETMIIHLLSTKGKQLDENTYKIVLNKKRLYRELALINDNWVYIKQNNIEDRLSFCSGEENVVIPPTIVNDFISVHQKKIKYNVERALNSLEKQMLIMWKHSFCIGYKNKDGKIYHKNADEETEKKILSIRRKVMEELLEGLTTADKYSESELYKCKLHNQWVKEVNKRVRKEVGCSFYYTAYSLITSESFVRMILKEQQKNDLQLRLNNNMMESANKTAEVNHRNALDRGDNLVKFNSPSYSETKFNRCDKNYVKYCKRIAELLVSLEDIETKFDFELYIKELNLSKEDILEMVENKDLYEGVVIEELLNKIYNSKSKEDIINILKDLDKETLNDISKEINNIINTKEPLMIIEEVKDNGIDFKL